MITVFNRKELVVTFIRKSHIFHPIDAVIGGVLG